MMFVVFALSALVSSAASSELCVCDTTTGCDVMCCCDPECSDLDKTSFICDTSVVTTTDTDVVCVAQNIISKISPDSSFTYTSEDGEYCFTASKPTETSSETKTVRLEPGSIEPQHPENPTYTKLFGNGTFFTVNCSSTLKANDPIYYQTTSGFYRPLTLVGDLRGGCVQDSVIFQRNTTSTCSAKITSELCAEGTKIDATALEGLKFIANFRASLTGTLEVDTTCLDSTGGSVTCRQPYQSAGNCNKVLSRIELTITHSAAVGLTAATLNLHLSTVTLDDYSTIDTIVSYNSFSLEYPNEGARYQRYKRGEELSFIINGAKTSFLPFTSTSTCPASLPITFPTSRIARCTQSIASVSTNCTDFAATLLSNLPSSLAKFSNSEVGNADEWLELNWAVPADVHCNSTPVTGSVVVAHRSTGSRLYPENELISASATLYSINLEKRALLNDQILFYFNVQFVSVDVDSSTAGNIISKLSATFPDYSVPVRMLFGAVGVFVVLSVAVVVRDQGKPEL